MWTEESTGSIDRSALTQSVLAMERDVALDRHAHRHGDSAWMATLLQDEQVVGRFTVQNLTAGGALLTGAHDVSSEGPLHVFLELRDGVPIELTARVRRRAVAGPLVVLAITFEHISAANEDRIQETLLRALDRRHRQRHPAVLVVDADPRARDALAREILDAGLRPLGFAAPLEALRALDDPDDPVAAVLVRESGDASGRALLSFVCDTHPAVRAVLVIEDSSSDPRVANGACRCHRDQLAAELRRPV